MVLGLNSQQQAELVDMQQFTKVNKGSTSIF